MHKAILMLVETHAKIGDLVPALVDRVLIALVTRITEVALRSFQQVPKYGTGGMLTVGSFSLLPFALSPFVLVIPLDATYSGL